MKASVLEISMDERSAAPGSGSGPGFERPRRLRRIGAVVGLAIAWLGLGSIPVTPAQADAWAPASVADLGPLEVVETTVGQVLAILADPALDSETRRKRIEQIAFDVFDFTTMSKLTLARNWKKLDDEQKRTFVREFKAHLSRSYGSRLDRYRQENVEIFGTREEPRGDVTVFTKIVGGQFDGIEMNYRLRNRKDRWRAIDVVIEGVSLIANFRSQFAEIMSKGGPEKLIADLRTKNFDAPGIDEDTVKDGGADGASGS
jgi:phospholipid transport system substrate-binding protein